jgi:hypothetical protein
MAHVAASAAKFRAAKPDIWLTVSGWIWLAYAVGILALAVAAAT